MAKKQQPAQVMLGPVPAALIGCGNAEEQNIITLAWVGVVNSSPPMVSIAVRPNRHSHRLIEESAEFTVNLPLADQVEIVDGCGTLSGKGLDKFAKYNLTPVKGTLLHAPFIEECPISMDCKVEKQISLGSHDLFIGRIIASYVAEEFLDTKGKIAFGRFNLLGFSAGSYLQAASLDLSIGYTVKEK